MCIRDRRAGLIGGIVGDGDFRAFRDGRQVGGLAAKDEHRLQVHAKADSQMGALLGVEVVQIRDVLEVVGVQFFIFQRGVGHDVILEFDNFELVALGLEQGFRCV